MAVLYITEFANHGIIQTGVAVQVPAEPALTDQTVAIGGASAQSAAFGSATQLVVVNTDAICSIKVGTNPTATTSTHRLAANATYSFTVPRGESYKIAVIANV